MLVYILTDKNVILFATIQSWYHKSFIIYDNSSVGSKKYVIKFIIDSPLTILYF